MHDRKKERAKANASIVEFLKPGTKIRAMYTDEDNEPAVRGVLECDQPLMPDDFLHVNAQMYEAVIDSVEENNQYWVSTLLAGLGVFRLR